MPSPMNAPPGLAGYLLAQQNARQRGTTQLQQQGMLAELQQRLQTQQQTADDQKRNQAMMAEISAIPPEQRNRQTVLPIIMKYAKTPKDVVATLPDEQKAQPIGAGGLLRPDGSVVPPAARPESPNPQPIGSGGLRMPDGTVVPPASRPSPSDLSRLIAERDALPAGDPRRAPYDAAIKKKTESTTDKSYPIVTTGDGIFERRPEGLVQLKDPKTGQPLKPTARERPITEYQGKNALYGTRASDADKSLLELEEKINVAGLATKQAVQNMPVIGGPAGAAGNAMLSANQQKVEQAQRNFVNAVLRQESGAVISDAEFENAKKQYFPQPGDSKAVIEQKRRNRRLAIEGFKRIAGPAWPEEQPAQPVSGGFSIRPL